MSHKTALWAVLFFVIFKGVLLPSLTSRRLPPTVAITTASHLLHMSEYIQLFHLCANFTIFLFNFFLNKILCNPVGSFSVFLLSSRCVGPSTFHPSAFLGKYPPFTSLPRARATGSECEPINKWTGSFRSSFSASEALVSSNIC